MKIKNSKEFINALKKFKIDTEYLVVKPNWVSIREGEYTDSEILTYLFEAFPDKKKIVIESYTPWRGMNHKKVSANLNNGKDFWEDYKKQDEYFFKETGIDKVLKQYKVDYINITNEFWNDDCVDANIIKKETEDKFGDIIWEKLYKYFPKKLYQIKDKATFISLAKIKTEDDDLNIVISLSIKNLFGLIPHPSRKKSFHKKNSLYIPRIITDINKIYATQFSKSLWVNEGIKTLIREYCSDKQYIERDKGLAFIGKDPLKVDIETCQEFDIDPNEVPYFKLLNKVWNN